MDTVRIMSGVTGFFKFVEKGMPLVLFLLGGVLWVAYILHTLSTSLGKKRVGPGIVLLFVLQGGKRGGIPLDVTTKRLDRAGGTGEWQDRRWGLE
jgi:hypothetical protein